MFLVDPSWRGKELSGFTFPLMSVKEIHLDGLRESPSSPAALSMHWITSWRSLISMLMMVRASVYPLHWCSRPGIY